MKNLFNSMTRCVHTSITFDLKMKLTLLIFVLALFQLQANTGYAQKTKIDIDMKNASIFEIIEDIESKTEFRFFYSKEDLTLGKKVNISEKRVTVDKILKKIFFEGSINYKIIDRQIVLTRNESINNSEQELAKPERQEPILINGIVNDASGVTLPGANILEKGTSNGTQSDFDGTFSIKVADKNAVLVITYIGFTSVEIPVNDQTNIVAVLQEDSQSLDEIVVVGYGTQRKGSITGSISTVKSKDLVQTPSTNTSSLLAGRLPGLVVRQNDGQPGGDTANISVRGFGGALVIVDGVPRDFQQLDPNTIESISILKDAAAAVYGARAGNGVILVTTMGLFLLLLKEGKLELQALTTQVVLHFNNLLFCLI